MKVNELLKGKKAYEKEYMLDDKNANPELVDKLATDPAKKVRYKAIHHNNFTSNGAWKVVTQKKNFKEEYILGSAFSKLTSEQVLEWYTKEFDTNIESGLLANLEYDIMRSFKNDKKATDKLLVIFINKILSDTIYPNWYVGRVIGGYPIFENEELLTVLKKKYPDKIIRYRDELKLTQKQQDEYLKLYLDISSYWKRPVDDLGYSYIESLSEKNITLLLSNVSYPTDKTLVSFLLANKNLNATHTRIMLGDSKETDSEIFQVIEKAPLNDECEKVIYEMFTADPKYKDWKVLELLALNKTHNKKTMLATINALDENEGFSTKLIEQLLISRLYTEKEIESLIDSQSDYTQFSINTTAVKHDGFPKNKLRELWDKYWKGEWKEGEIPGPTGYAGDDFTHWNFNYEQSRTHELLYNLVKYSSLAGEFGVEYYEKFNDEKYLPEEAKDIFLF